jgi:hypothetical protein
MVVVYLFGSVAGTDHEHARSKEKHFSAPSNAFRVGKCL